MHAIAFVVCLCLVAQQPPVKAPPKAQAKAKKGIVGRDGMQMAGKIEKVAFNGKLLTKDGFAKKCKPVIPVKIATTGPGLPVWFVGRVGERKSPELEVNPTPLDKRKPAGVVIVDLAHSTESLGQVKRGQILAFYGWFIDPPAAGTDRTFLCAAWEPAASDVPGLRWVYKIENRAEGVSGRTLWWDIYVTITNTGAHTVNGLRLEARLLVNEAKPQNAVDASELYIGTLAPGQTVTKRTSLINWLNAEYAPKATIKVLEGDVADE